MLITVLRIVEAEQRLALTAKPCVRAATWKRERVMTKKSKPEKWFAWQLDAFEAFRKSIEEKSNFLCAVSGGGGKTLFALENAKVMLANREIDRVIVVTFTRHLIRQWDDWATAIGLNLLAVSGNQSLKDGIPGDVVGYICTYAAMGRMPDLHASYTSGFRTLVIFDEIHHLGDEDDKGRSEWGKKAKVAFSAASYRLGLSGTPFRSNQQRIPFVSYEPIKGSNMDSQAVPDFTYSYGDAVADEICRRVDFLDVDGLIEWERSDNPGVTYQHRFSDEIDERYYGDRLRFAVSAETDGSDFKNLLLVDMIKHANNKLNDIRKVGHPDAAGLVIASNVMQAKLLKDMMQRITGHRAIIVHNEEDRSLSLIQDFAKGISPWIISVKMISEGVDIPRLRVCLYAANVTKELFLMQVIFRIVRRSKEIYGESYFYYPADPEIVTVVRKVEEEMNVKIRYKQGKDPKPHDPPVFVDKNFIGAKAEKWQATIAGETFAMDDLVVAEEFRKQRPDLRNVDIRDLVRFYRDFRRYEKREAESPMETQENYNERRDRLRREIQEAVGRLHYRMQKPHNEIHHRLNSAVGVPDKKSATIEQLEKMLHIAAELEAEYNGDDDVGQDDDGF
jgi:superfamily II DNA or RNA helicase